MSNRSQGRVCSVCGVVITNGNRSGMCRLHNNAEMNADPELRRKRGAGIARHFRDNPGKASLCAKLSAASRLANPVEGRKMRERMKKVQALSCTPEAIAARDCKARRAKQLARQRAWCPPAYLPLYEQLMRTVGIKMAEAKAMVLQQAAADAKRARAAMPRPTEPELSPFERQMLALERGASLQDNVRLDRHSDSAAELRAKLA